MIKFIKNEATKSRVKKNSNGEEISEDEEQAIQAEQADLQDEIPSKEFDYLLSMPLWSLTEERVDDLIK